MPRPAARALLWRTTPRFSFLFPVVCHTALNECGGSAPAVKSRLRLFYASVAVLLLSLGIAQAQPISNSRSATIAIADPLTGFIAEASQRFALPASSIRAVMQVESGGDVRAFSPKGAMGLMQIMPTTWTALRQRYGLGADPYDPHDNIMAGTAYLRELQDRFGESGFLAAYNAGPGRYEEHLATGRPLPSETVAYMATVTALLDGSMPDGSRNADSWASSSLFVKRAESAIGPFQASRADASGHRSANVRSSTMTPLAPLPEGLFARASDQSARP